MVQQVAVALYDRGDYSRGDKRRVFGYEAYHWGIIIMPDGPEERDYHAFSATDVSEINPVTFRMHNPTMTWWLRAEENVKPDENVKPLGCIVIGEVPEDVTFAQLDGLFHSISLPVKNTHPQQSCVTWIVYAVQALQEQGWVTQFDLDEFKDRVVSYADERMEGSNSQVIFYQS
ncbi:serine threonine kinase [Fusarium mundagurra]|uniref:Serine threonine kinase n=1 Tax=Fusarium mundagurra TaxID=1567541 RepID=A0A8H5YJ49_9HYPO|nr:serine threonine kinase [Fusarium mundagurra]